jgi:hypothetical protein
MRLFRPRAVKVQFDATVTWHYAQDPETGAWIGVCPALNLNAVGDTWAEMQEAVVEATGLLFVDLFEAGELESFLREKGWHVSQLPKPGQRVQFDVPLNVSRAPIQELVPAGA